MKKAEVKAMYEVSKWFTFDSLEKRMPRKKKKAYKLEMVMNLRKLLKR